MDSFHDVRFPLGVAFGTTGGPERRNEIVALHSGREKRNTRQAGSRRHYDAGTGLRSLEDLQEVLAFFEARRGSLHAFRFRDPFDMKSCKPDETPSPFDQTIGVGDGATARFQLQKLYGDGADVVTRRIGKPVAGTVRVAVGPSEQQIGSDVTVDALTGEITFQVGTIPASGATITAGFEFDVPVRFDIERLSLSVHAFQAGQIPTIPLVEVLDG